MIAATYILAVMGLFGAADMLFYHSVAHGIRHHPDSKSELIVHSLRGPTYGALYLLIPNFSLEGWYFWALIALFAGDLAISIVDFSIERRSRAFFGGLPSGEYVLHIIIAMGFGALVTAVFFGAYDWANMPARMAYAPVDVPIVVRGVLAVMAVVVFLSGVQDAIAAIRLHGATRRMPATEPAGAAAGALRTPSGD